MKKNMREYHRSLSAEEVRDKQIMITKDALGFFPKPFKKFSVAVGVKKFELAVESVSCKCRGPALPHEHYWLPVKEVLAEIRWERGTRITVKKEKDSSYKLTAG